MFHSSGRGVSSCRCLQVACRRFSKSDTLLKKEPNNLKGKKVAAQSWLRRQLNDPYVKRAQSESYRCRSAFKLLEIDDKHRLLKAGSVVVDCGAAPGSWCQVAVDRVNSSGARDGPVGTVIGVDLQQMLPVSGAKLFSQADITHQSTQQKILDFLNGGKVDIVLSDMAPSPTGVRSMDHEVIVKLCMSALKFSSGVLAEGGSFLCKLWEGNQRHNLENLMKLVFEKVRVVKPMASRTDSAEIFILAKNFTGVPPRSNSLSQK